MSEKNNIGIEAAVIRNIRISKHDLRVSLNGVKNTPGGAASIFGELAKGDINVNLIVQNMTLKGEGWTDISFTVKQSDLDRVTSVLEQIKSKEMIEGFFVHEDEKIFVVEGDGMQTHSDIAARIFKRLGDAKVNIEMICTSELEISCAVRSATIDSSLEMLRQEFKNEIS